MFFKPFFASLAAAMLLSAPVGAACVYPAFEFFPEKNGGVEVPVEVETGGSCRHNFAEGKGYHFTDVDIATEPPHGSLTKTGKTSFLYAPEAGYTGKDVYSFQICATKGKKAGCTLIMFAVTVKEAAKPAPQPSSSGECGSDSPDAIAACTPFIENAKTSQVDRARALRWRGIAYFRVRDLDRALSDFTAAIGLDASDADTFSNRGLVFQWKHDLDRALADYDRAIALNPKLYAAFANRGNAYRLKSDFPRAIADYDEALSLNPRFGGAYLGRGIARQMLKDRDGALADFTRAVEVSPDNAEAYVARGNIFGAEGDSEKAFADYDSAVKAAPKFAGAYINRGAVLLARGDLDRALADLEKAIALDPRNGMAISNRGLILSQKGEFARAIADFDTALRLANNASILANRGFAHFARGDFPAAAADFAKFGEAEPKHAYAALWRSIVEAHDGSAARTAPENAAAPADGSPWPAPVVAFLQGRLTREELDRAASQGDAKARRGQACETAFYLGEQALLEKRPDDARALIEKAVDVCPSDFLERIGALGEQRRLQR
jgi:tetratricopeptide (TPR) repeat protein